MFAIHVGCLLVFLKNPQNQELLYGYKCWGSCRLCLDGNAYGDGDGDEKGNGDAETDRQRKEIETGIMGEGDMKGDRDTCKILKGIGGS